MTGEAGGTRIRALLLGVALSLSAPSPGHGQVLRGWVVRADRTPIADAGVRLRTLDGALAATTTSDVNGRFTLRPRASGTMRLEASHLGFADWETSEFAVSEEIDVDVVIQLQVEAIPLAALTVEARARQSTRRLEGFERRRGVRAFGGHFLAEEEIARRPMSRPSNLVLATPGMTVRGGRGAFDFYTIYSGSCPATVYVDGVRIDQTRVSVDEYLDLDRIAGVEVYPRGMNVPPEFQDTMRPACGTVVYWTKDLEPDQLGGWSATKVALGIGGVVGLLLLGWAR